MATDFDGSSGQEPVFMGSTCLQVAELESIGASCETRLRVGARVLDGYRRPDWYGDHWRLQFVAFDQNGRRGF